jgi:transcriptional regulator with XRE-family HTH domain
MIMSGQMSSPFGVRLRQWRQRRGLSQLALAGLVGSTSRHISFLETGRSRPSQDMTLRLATALDVGLREANALLRAAGLRAAYLESELDGRDLAPYRRTLDRLLAAHDPYPAMVLDRHWNVVLANRSALRLFGPALVGVNFVRDALADPAARAGIINWAEVAWAGVERLRHQAEHEPFDQQLRELVRVGEAALADVARPATGADVAVCPTFLVDGTTVRTIAMVARFDPAADLTLAELRVELMYPADPDADRFFHALAGPSAGE